MTFQIVLSFLAFVFLSGITPGPANLTSLATSLQYGRKTALRQWTGLLSGCMTDALVSVVTVYFIGTVFSHYVKWLAFAGVAYLLYLAIHILLSSYSADQKKIKEPGFWRGFLIQITNVKIILTCITALSSYVLPASTNFPVILIFGLCLGVIQPSCNLVWLFSGVALQKFFVNHTKLLNIIMAAALILCAVSLAIVPFRY